MSFFQNRANSVVFLLLVALAIGAIIYGLLSLGP